MPILVNLHHLEHQPLELNGVLPATELDIADRDPAVRLLRPISYALRIEHIGGSLEVSGWLEATADCLCVRCLKGILLPVRLDPWAAVLPLTGDEAVPVNHYAVDLTPVVREDIVLALPQHPLCEPECRGLSAARPDVAAKPSGDRPPAGGVSPWDTLNKLQIE